MFYNATAFMHQWFYVHIIIYRNYYKEISYNNNEHTSIMKFNWKTDIVLLNIFVSLTNYYKEALKLLNS